MINNYLSKYNRNIYKYTLPIDKTLNIMNPKTFKNLNTTYTTFEKMS